MSSLPGVDPHAEIARIEAELDQLAEAGDRCRKIALVSKLAILAGGIGIGLIFGGAIASGGLSLMCAIILLLGGTVVFGSNATTAQQIAARIKTAEALRADLIGAIELRVVSDP